MQPTTFSIAIHPGHIFHPFDQNRGLDARSTLQKVAGIALLIFTGILTFGISLIFYCVLAERKIKKCQETGQFNTVLKKVKRAVKPALFLGRKDNQSVPQNDGFTWFTLDLERINPWQESSKHFKVDFNDPEKMPLLKRLFDSVVVDTSTLRYIDGLPWERLKTLLKPIPTSTLITETSALHPLSNSPPPTNEEEIKASFQHDAPHGNMEVPLQIMNQEARNKNDAFAQWKASKGDEAEREYQRWKVNLTDADLGEFFSSTATYKELKSRALFTQEIFQRENLAYDRPYERYQALFREVQQNYLKTLFSQVELKKEPYPGRPEDTEAREYYEMKGSL